MPLRGKQNQCGQPDQQNSAFDIYYNSLYINIHIFVPVLNSLMRSVKTELMQGKENCDNGKYRLFEKQERLK